MCCRLVNIKNVVVIVGCGLNVCARTCIFAFVCFPTVVNLLSNSYTMGCPSVHGDNPRALASRLSYVQVDKHNGITILYLLHQCRPCTSRDISCSSW